MDEQEVTVYEDDSGQAFVRVPGTGNYIPVTEDQIGTLQEGGLTALVRSADNAIQQAGTGARALGARIFGAEETEHQAMEKLGGLRTEAELRGGANPIASGIGAVAPDMALGAMTGGIGSVAGRIGASAALEGALGASRNPEAPLMGAAVQGAAGALGMGAGPAASRIGRAVHPYTSRVSGAVGDVIRRTRGAGDEVAGIYESAAGRRAMGEAVEGAAERGAGRVADDAILDEVAQSGSGRAQSAGAAATDFPTTDLGTINPGGITADEMVDRWQFPMTKNGAAMRTAAVEGNDAAYELARRGDIEEELRSRTGGVLTDLWNGKRTDYTALRGAQRTAVRRNLAAELGMPQQLRLTRQTAGENLDRISEEIGGIIKQSGPVRSRPVLEQWKYLLRDNEEGPAGQQLRRWIRQLEEKGANAVSPQDAAAIRNRISEAMEWAGRNEPDPEAVRVFGTARMMLDQELKKRWTPEMQETFEQLGYQWKLTQALVRGQRGALNDRGDVNFSTFMGNWRMLDNAVRTGRKRESEFLRFMEAAGEQMMKETPDSGTPAGLAARVGEVARDMALAPLGPLGAVLR